MLIHVANRADWKFHINLDQVAFAYIHEDEYGYPHRIEMSNGECFDIRVDEYDKIVKYLDKEDQ